MKWTIIENKMCNCPGLTIDDLPTPIPTNLHVLHKVGELCLVAENIAGIVPCNSGHSITIEPKYRKIRPIDMLYYINNISNTDSSTEQVIQQGESTVDINTIAEFFARELISIQCRQRMIKRQPVKQYSSVIKGKVNWLQTAQLQMTGKIHSIATTIREASYDIPENAVISIAAQKVLPLFSKNTAEWKALCNWANMPYSNGISIKALERMQRALVNQQFSGAHAFYYRPVMLAKIILGFDNAVVKHREGESLLFNMPVIYEEYIRTAFQRVTSPRGLTCQKGFIPRSFLFYNGECELIPDIAIYYGSNIRAILDVKYKTPDSKDYYQVYTYMKFAGLKLAYIISPSVKHEETIIAYDGCKIINIRIDSSNPATLENEATKIINTI